MDIQCISFNIISNISLNIVLKINKLLQCVTTLFINLIFCTLKKKSFERVFCFKFD